jgi:DNA-binding NarL/FixJ family response regulator
MRRGQGGAVFVRGDAGIGKTRLLTDTIATFGLPPDAVIWTAAFDYAPSPFAPIVDAAERLQSTRSRLLAANPRLRLAIERIVHADEADQPPSAANVRRFFDGIAELFRLAAAESPLLLVIDDLHHSDPATLSLLFHIMAATRDCSFLLLASYQSGEEERRPALREPWARLERLPNTTMLELAPLSDEETAALVRSIASDLPRDVRDGLAARAEGNPLFAHELVRQARLDGERRGRVPSSIAQAVLARYASLSDDARRALRRAAVIGRTFDSRLVAACCGYAAADIHDRLRDALQWGLIEETPDCDVFRFRHALSHEAIYGELLAAERRDAHRLVLELLEAAPRAPSDYALLALHAFAANQREAAADYSEKAGDHFHATRAYESAIEHFERSRTLVDGAAIGARLDRKIAAAWLFAGFPDRAVAPATSALAHYRCVADIEHSSALLFLLAECAGQSGADERRLELLDEASRLLSSASEARLRAKHWFCRSEIALANQDALQAIASSTGISDREIDLSDALALCNVRAHALLTQRKYDEAIDAQSDAVRIAEATRETDVMGSARFGLGVVLALSGRLAEAQSSFLSAAAETSASLAMTESSLSTGMAAEMALIRGDTMTARALFEEVLPHARRRDRPSLIVQIGRVGLFLGLRTDDRSLVRRTVESLELEALFRHSTPERYFPLSGAYAQFLVAEGRHAEAREVLRRAVRRLSSRRLRSTDWSPCSVLTVAEYGDEADIAAARRPIADWFTPYGAAFVLLFDALAAARTGAHDAAAALAERAVDDFRRYGFAYEEASSLRLAGRREEALSKFTTFGARPDVSRIRDELSPRNRRGRRSGELTAREREVAELVAEGFTNRGIADRLSVSEKTVEAHLSSIFARLDIRTRGEVAERLMQLSADAG